MGARFRPKSPSSVWQSLYGQAPAESLLFLVPLVYGRPISPKIPLLRLAEFVCNFDINSTTPAPQTLRTAIRRAITQYEKERGRNDALGYNRQVSRVSWSVNTDLSRQGEGQEGGEVQKGEDEKREQPENKHASYPHTTWGTCS